MSSSKFISVLFTFIPISAAKFHYTYRGIAHDGVQACIANSNFTFLNITSRRNCRPAFECVMQNIPNHSQSILSSGSSILGFIPTILLLLGNSNEDIVRISARFPLLAFFLSITNVNKIPMRATHALEIGSGSFSLGAYGYVPNSTGAAISTWRRFFVIALVHFLAASGAAIVVWQTVDLARKAVVTWACCTDFYPLIWVGAAVTHHLKAVAFLRASLRISNIQSRKSTKGDYLAPQSGLRVWNLMEGNQKSEIAHKKLLRWSKAFTDLLNNFNFLYGTAIFSSLTLVSGRNAITVLSVYGLVAVFSRVIAVWVLERIMVLD